MRTASFGSSSDAPAISSAWPHCFGPEIRANAKSAFSRTNQLESDNRAFATSNAPQESSGASLANAFNPEIRTCGSRCAMLGVNNSNTRTSASTLLGGSTSRDENNASKAMVACSLTPFASSDTRAAAAVNACLSPTAVLPNAETAACRTGQGFLLESHSQTSATTIGCPRAPSTNKASAAGTSARTPEAESSNLAAMAFTASASPTGASLAKANKARCRTLQLLCNIKGPTAALAAGESLPAATPIASKAASRTKGSLSWINVVSWATTSGSPEAAAAPRAEAAIARKPALSLERPCRAAVRHACEPGTTTARQAAMALRRTASERSVRHGESAATMA
mmetsp:Transcript_105451/g.303140  ORF Transcript_105451/g.303140 Transcript_105451/m.303140 type:complete len:339 (-) Transcript_105451:1268-2284(-)